MDCPSVPRSPCSSQRDGHFCSLPWQFWLVPGFSQMLQTAPLPHILKSSLKALVFQYLDRTQICPGNFQPVLFPQKSEESVKPVCKYAVRASHRHSVRRLSHTRQRDEFPVEPNRWPANTSSCSVLQNFSAKAFRCYLIIEFFITNPWSELADLLLQGCACCWQTWAWIFALSAWVHAAPG